MSKRPTGMWLQYDDGSLEFCKVDPPIRFRTNLCNLWNKLRSAVHDRYSLGR